MNIHFYQPDQLLRASQTRDVFDVSRQLAIEPFVKRVLIFSRRVVHQHISDEFSRKTQRICPKVWIIRMHCGDRDNWEPCRTEQEVTHFASNAIHFSELNRLRPSLVHGDCFVAQHVAEYYGNQQLNFSLNDIGEATSAFQQLLYEH